MPIYAYRCSSCGHQQDFLRKVSDPPLTTCPKCSQETLSKMLTAAGFQLKGTGWYVTDFRGNSGAGGSDTKSDSGSGESKSDTKSGETKSDSGSGTSSSGSSPGGSSSGGSATGGSSSADASAP